ncbi:hypothetical protein BIWAKO_05736 [Bosea sp. BIWAKO-01]|nr:hypothetical protein BIWAKO_05736 [Bosea sp. BIWAKO-01]
MTPMHSLVQPIPRTCPISRIGNGAGHHFFGYYDKTNWGAGNRILLGHRVAARDFELAPDSVAEIGYFDLAGSGEFHVCGRTTAWNWQMGSQLQWLDAARSERLIYNIRTDGSTGLYPGFGSVIFDRASGCSRQLDTPIYVAAPNGRYALTVDYERLYVTHKTIGYAGLAGRRADLQPCPGDDGIHRLDLETGETRLLVSYADLKALDHRPSMAKAIHWVSHIEINPSSNRILFLHRWTERVEDETCFLHRLITMDPDGGSIRLLECSDHPLPQLQDDFDPTAVGTFDYEKSEYQISHPLWRDDDHIIVWGPHAGAIHYHLYEDAEPALVSIVGKGVLTENGHMTYSPVDQRWLLTDTYPDPVSNERILILYDVANDIRYDIGTLYADPKLTKENRCDLHPRWSQDGRTVCIDSMHEHERQIYAIDVSSIVGA